MAAMIVSDQAERNDLNALISGWSTVTIRLHSNNITPDANTVLGDFAEATYSGYAAQTVTWSAAATDGTGRGYTLSSTVTFPLAGSGTQVAYGWYATIAGPLLVMSKKLDAAVTISTTVAVDAFSIKFTLRQEP